jgi:cytochrome P450
VRRVFEPALAPVEQRLRDGGVVDLADLTRVLVGRMMAELLGLARPEDDDDRYRALFGTGERLARLALGSAASTELPPETVARAKSIVDDLTRNVPTAYAEAGADTLLGRCRELGLTLPETTGLAALLMVAGTETAATAMTRTTALLHDTDQQRLLLDDPELLAPAVREGLRVTTPAPVIGRSVSRDVTVHKARMRAGDRVLLLTYAANNRVGRFDITRPYVPETRQLWFGAGRHLCLGAALARAEIERFLTAVLSAGPLRVVARTPAAGVLVPSYQRFLVTRADRRHQSAAPVKLVGSGR